jgi:protein TonB
MNPFIVSLTGLLLLAGTTGYGQSRKKAPEESFYALNEDWKGTTIDKARYILRELKFNDTCYQWDTYYVSGPLIKSAVSKDDKGQIGNGRFVFYNEKGRADSIGYYVNGLRHGSWKYLNNSNKVVYEKVYDKGTLVSERDVRAEDSLKKLMNTDKTADIERESEFPGATQGWVRYLNRNLRYPQRAINLRQQGQVNILFTVTETGKIEEPILLKSVELSLDDEAMRMIKISPDWEPAEKNGQKVRSYKIQPIVFRLQ